MRRERQREPAVDQRRPDAVARLRQRRVGQPDQRERGHPGRDVGLDLDDVPLQPEQRHRAGRGRGPPTPPPAGARPGRRPRRGDSTPTTSIRTSGTHGPARASQRGRQPPQPRQLDAASTASAGVPSAVRPAGLHLADDEHVAVERHDVDLASARTASCARAPSSPGSTRCRAATSSPYSPTASFARTPDHLLGHDPGGGRGRRRLEQAAGLWTTGRRGRSVDDGRSVSCSGDRRSSAARARSWPAPRR